MLDTSFFYPKITCRIQVYEHVLTSRVKNIVDPDQLASEKPADLDLHFFSKSDETRLGTEKPADIDLHFFSKPDVSRLGTARVNCSIYIEPKLMEPLYFILQYYLKQIWSPIQYRM